MTNLNFPAAAASGATHNAANGLQYSYDGVKWTSQGAYTSGVLDVVKLDNIASQFNGTLTSFNLTASSVGVNPANAESLTISLGGVIQEPQTAYTINSATGVITFASAPAAGTTFFGLLNSRLPVDTASIAPLADGAVSSEGKLANGVVTNAKVSDSAAINSSKLSFTQTGTDAVSRTVDSKLKDTISPFDFGAVGDGTTDDRTALQAAINAAEAIVGDRTGPTDIEAAYAVVDLGGRKYSISGSLIISEAIVLQNGAIVASSTFPINNYCIRISDTAERAVIQRVDIDGGLYTLTRRGNGIRVNAPRVNITRCYVNHFPQFGIRVSTTGPNNITTQEVRIENCLVREWQYDETGRRDFNLRTAKGISIEVADCYVINTTAAQCLRPVYLSGSLNIIDACHFYNGGLDTKTGTYSQSGTTVTVTLANHGVKVNDHVKADYTTGSAVDGFFMVQTVPDVNTFTLTAASSATNSGNVDIELSPVAVEVDNTVNTIFSGCYFDNGTIDIKTSFKHNITGCHFQRTSNTEKDKFIQTFTSATNETVQGLIVTGNNFNGGFTPIAFQVTGSGSYVEDIFKQITWLGNSRGDGGIPWKHAKFGSSAYLEHSNMYLSQASGSFNFKGIQGITLEADYDNNSIEEQSLVEIKTDGSSKFIFDHKGDLLPQNVNYNITQANITEANPGVLTATGHGLVTGQALTYVSNGTNLVTSSGTAVDETQFYVIKVNDNSFQLASSLANATAGTALQITDDGNDLQVFRTSTARVGSFGKPLNTVFTDNVSLKPVSQPPNLKGKVYYDNPTDKLKFYNGTAWETISSGQSGVFNSINLQAPFPVIYLHDTDTDADDYRIVNANGTLKFQESTGGVVTDRLSILPDGAVRASTGMLFGSDTADANTLDDYEEGTFTPTLEGYSSNPTVTYTTQTGHYTKIGNVVHIQLVVAFSSYTGGGGAWQVSGLPFTASSTAPTSFNFGWEQNNKVNWGGTVLSLGIYVSGGTNILRGRRFGSNVNSALNLNSFSSTEATVFGISGSYIAA